jgi:hypothetical protein
MAHPLFVESPLILTQETLPDPAHHPSISLFQRRAKHTYIIVICNNMPNTARNSRISPKRSINSRFSNSTKVQQTSKNASNNPPPRRRNSSKPQPPRPQTPNALQVPIPNQHRPPQQPNPSSTHKHQIQAQTYYAIPHPQQTRRPPQARTPQALSAHNKRLSDAGLPFRAQIV